MANNIKEKTVQHDAFTQVGYVAYVFMIISTVLTGILLIPLAWHIPMTIHYKHKAGYVGTGFKVCSLLFCTLISGILMLCDTKTNQVKIKK